MDLSLRPLRAADLPAIDALLRANKPLFSDVEIKTAIDMIHETLAKPGDEDPYQFVVAELGGRVVGYASFGTIPLTKGSFDLYWIAVHPEAHARGLGKKILLWVEQEIRRQGGHLIVVETSNRKEYEKTRYFYEKTMRYATAAWIKDFYKLGDDKVLYIKYLDGRA